MITVFRHHLHKCPGLTTACIQRHEAHVWRCFRPNCEAEPVYLCGLIADTIARREANGLKNLEKGREVQRLRRLQFKEKTFAR